MLRRDTRAGFLKNNSNGYYFLEGRRARAEPLKKWSNGYYHAMDPSRDIPWLPWLHESEFQQLLKLQESTPVVVKRSNEDGKTWWWFRGEFYWEDEGYKPDEVKALLLERLKKKERKTQRAISLMELEGSPLTGKREPIPDDVKLYVWRRDGGKCVKCGSQEKLEFDHVIPLSKGGSNTARNIQILCQECNRTKGDSLV
jgi:hypothetical protein